MILQKYDMCIKARAYSFIIQELRLICYAIDMIN